jgi:hypothetical protein
VYGRGKPRGTALHVAQPLTPVLTALPLGHVLFGMAPYVHTGGDASDWATCMPF